MKLTIRMWLEGMALFSLIYFTLFGFVLYEINNSSLKVIVFHIDYITKFKKKQLLLLHNLKKNVRIA